MYGLIILALTFIGMNAVIVYTVPDTPYDADAHAEAVAGLSDTYTWKCPQSEGGYTTETLYLHVDVSPDNGYLRHSIRMARAPVFLVDAGDPYVKAVAEYLDGLAQGYGDYMRVSVALAFTQTATPYITDEELYGCREYWAVPSETLRYHGGDCEDTAVLLASILEAMGIDWVLLKYTDHLAVGAVIEGYDCLYCESARSSVVPPGYGERPDPSVFGKGSISEAVRIWDNCIAEYRGFLKKTTGI